jgi:hypothetical protein
MLQGDDHLVKTSAGPVTGDASFTAKGDFVKVDLVAGTYAPAWTEATADKADRKDKKASQPAIVLNTFGTGKTIYFAFDIADSLDGDKGDVLSSIVSRSLPYIHRASAQAQRRPYELVPIRLSLLTTGNDLDLKVAETYPQLIRLYEAEHDTWITSNPWIRELHVTPQKGITSLFYGLMPDVAGTYVLKTDITPLITGPLSVNLVVERTIGDQLTMILTALDSLNDSGSDKKEIAKAKKALQDLKTRALSTSKGLDDAIGDLLAAAASVSSVGLPEAPEIRLMLGVLLRELEGKWYLLSTQEKAGDGDDHR